MVPERYVNVLETGDIFRDWLIEELDNRIQNKNCKALVYKMEQGSHTVCMYEFEGDYCKVVAKFFAEPKGWNELYDPVKSMKTEFDRLKKLHQIINVPCPIAIKKRFNCALLTEYIQGMPLSYYMENGIDLYGLLTILAKTLRVLHDNTKSGHNKKMEFAHFHNVLDQIKLDCAIRERFNDSLGDWWHSGLLDQSQGCVIHNDPNFSNYLFRNNEVYALDFEGSWTHANPLQDLGIFSAHLKKYFKRHKNDGDIAEPFIGHFLWRYSKCEKEFQKLTEAFPFFMSLGMIRTTHLNINPEYRAYIIKESLACLEARWKRGVHPE
jgi:aminoglycoside phosphotransferase (APT) family kinase protein